MEDQPKYLIVDTTVIPEVFCKVVEAKQFIARGKAKNASEAAKMVGISRSAFYKYKDSVFCYSKATDSTITFHVTLEDRVGVLSSLLSEFYKAAANILTVNQNLPIDGVAQVCISARTDLMNCENEEIVKRMKEIDGVVQAKII